MEGTDAFTEEIENDMQQRNEPHPIFKEATPDNLQKFKEKNLNQNTTKSINTWVNRFEVWRTWRKLPHKLEETPKQELSSTLERFLWRYANPTAVSTGQPTHNAGSLR